MPPSGSEAELCMVPIAALALTAACSAHQLLFYLLWEMLKGSAPVQHAPGMHCPSLPQWALLLLKGSSVHAVLKCQLLSKLECCLAPQHAGWWQGDPTSLLGTAAINTSNFGYCLCSVLTNCGVLIHTLLGIRQHYSTQNYSNTATQTMLLLRLQTSSYRKAQLNNNNYHQSKPLLPTYIYTDIKTKANFHGSTKSALCLISTLLLTTWV